MNPTIEVKLSANSVRLSEPLQATLVLEGASPLIVTPPKPLLQGTSRQSWLIESTGPPTVAPLLDGQERWTQTYKLEPFAAGPAVPVEFAPVVVSGRTLTLPAMPVEVRSGLAANAEIRSLAGPEPLPPEPRTESSPWGAVLAIGFACIVLVAAAWHRLRRPAAVGSPALTPLQRLTAIEGETEPRKFIELVSLLLRDVTQTSTCTTTEIISENPQLAAVLATCDAVLFAGEPLCEERRAAVLVEARSLLASGQSATLP